MFDSEIVFSSWQSPHFLGEFPSFSPLRHPSFLPFDPWCRAQHHSCDRARRRSATLQLSKGRHRQTAEPWRHGVGSFKSWGIYHDLPWFTMIYHDLPWFTMIYQFSMKILSQLPCFIMIYQFRFTRLGFTMIYQFRFTMMYHDLLPIDAPIYQASRSKKINSGWTNMNKQHQRRGVFDNNSWEFFQQFTCSPTDREIMDQRGHDVWVPKKAMVFSMSHMDQQYVGISTTW